MAKAAASLANGQGDWSSGATVSTSGSVTATAGGVLFALVQIYKNTGETVSSISGVTAGSWTLVAVSGLQAPGYSIELWWAPAGGSPTSEAVTATLGGTPDTASIIISEITGTINTSSPIVQSNGGVSASAASVAGSFGSSFSDALNGTIMVAACGVNDGVSPIAPMVEVDDRIRGFFAASMSVNYYDGNDTTPEIESDLDPDEWVWAAAEILDTSATSSITPQAMHLMNMMRD